MFAAFILATFAASGIFVSGAELQGTWSATSQGGYLAGAWTAEARPSGDVTGTWMLQDATGKVLKQGGWSASKSAQAWNGAWRATISGSNGEYSGAWTSAVSLPAQAHFAEMLEFALRAVVSGTWKSGPKSGSWSIRASP